MASTTDFDQFTNSRSLSYIENKPATSNNNNLHHPHLIIYSKTDSTISEQDHKKINNE